MTFVEGRERSTSSSKARKTVCEVEGTKIQASALLLGCCSLIRQFDGNVQEFRTFPRFQGPVLCKQYFNVKIEDQSCNLYFKAIWRVSIDILRYNECIPMLKNIISHKVDAVADDTSRGALFQVQPCPESREPLTLPTNQKC
jgi:hypothetical protein